MPHFCPNCGTSSEKPEEMTWKKGEYDQALPDIEVKNIILLCLNCKYGWNCVGTKKVK